MEITINDLKCLLGDDKAECSHPILSMNKVFVRTLSYHYLGTPVEIRAGQLRLKDASWVADSGRFHEFLETGDPSEVEVYPGDVWVNLECVVDFCKFTHSLPTESK